MYEDCVGVVVIHVNFDSNKEEISGTRLIGKTVFWEPNEVLE